MDNDATATIAPIAVPPRSRVSKNAVPAAHVTAMAGFLSRAEQGAWISDHVPYDSHKAATARAQAYRRELEKTLAARVKSRVVARDGASFIALALRGE